MPSAFTTVNTGIARVLTNECSVTQAFDHANHVGAHPQPCKFRAIWDTGATGTVITQKVVDDCGLKPIGMAKVHGVNGEHLAEVYLIHLQLPNTVTYRSLEVTKGQLSPPMCLLIGMDVICRGDFSVTNYNGITKFSFRVPSQGHTDFVEELRQSTQAQFQHGGDKAKRKKKHKTFGKNK